MFLQINSSGEPTKLGVSGIEECEELIEHIISTCPRIQVKGLMTIGSTSERKFLEFANMRNMYNLVREKYKFTEFELSMGMSNDFEEAIEYGATVVRVGSALFGERPLRKTGGKT